MEQDWQEVKFKPRKPAGANSKQQEVNRAVAVGAPVETTKKFTTANKQHSQEGGHLRKLDAYTGGEEDDLQTKTVSKSVAMTIQQARQAKGWTQKELATRVNEQATVVNSYEAGKAIPSNQVLGKLERALGVKLRGKDIGTRSATDVLIFGL